MTQHTLPEITDFVAEPQWQVVARKTVDAQTDTPSRASSTHPSNDAGSPTPRFRPLSRTRLAPEKGILPYEHNNATRA